MVIGFLMNRGNVCFSFHFVNDAPHSLSHSLRHCIKVPLIVVAFGSFEPNHSHHISVALVPPPPRPCGLISSAVSTGGGSSQDGITSCQGASGRDAMSAAAEAKAVEDLVEFKAHVDASRTHVEAKLCMGLVTKQEDLEKIHTSTSSMNSSFPGNDTELRGHSIGAGTGALHEIPSCLRSSCCRGERGGDFTSTHLGAQNDPLPSAGGKDCGGNASADCRRSRASRLAR